MKSGKILKKAAVYLLLVFQAVVTIYPLIWMILSSLKDNVSFFVDPWSLPTEPRFYNYVTAWQEGIQSYMLNSILITVLTIGIVIFLS